MAIVGVSESPFPGGDSDRLVQSLLEQGGREHTFAYMITIHENWGKNEL